MDMIEEVFAGQCNQKKLEEIETLRVCAWQPILSPTDAKSRFKLDATDRIAWHFCLRDTAHDQFIACSRLSAHSTFDLLPDPESYQRFAETMNFPLAIMSRLAVLPRFRGRGYATRLDNLRIEMATRLAIKEVWIEVRAGRIAYLEESQFKVMGNSADDSVPGNWFMMRRQLEDGTVDSRW
ncbi:MAG: GNAT family N-acetyltransferase [Gammaproteobacteria bacterium]|jgi:GNAT superfamily N-acetyltransferase